MGVLDGKVALVTGVSKGIGAGIAKGLAAAGASVVVNYASSKEGADRVVSEVAERGGKAFAPQGNVSKPDDVKQLFEVITQVLANDLRPKKIRVNSINPGGTGTEGAHALGATASEFEKHVMSQTPLGRFGQPEDIAPVAVFLSYWITGEILPASGGMR